MADHSLLDLIAGTIASDQRASTPSVEKAASQNLTFKRDEKGILWSYDESGNKVGRIFEHGDDDHIDTIKEV